MKAPAAEVWHLALWTEPGQKRGISLYETVYNIDREHSKFIKSFMMMAKRAAQLLIQIKNKAGGVSTRPANSDPTEKRESDNPLVDARDLDLENGTVLNTGPGDDVISMNMGPPPAQPDVIDAMRLRESAQAFGVSTMHGGGRYEGSGYTPVRVATQMDLVNWSRYEEILYMVARALYDRWEYAQTAARKGSGKNAWHWPKLPPIDVQRQRTAENIALRNKTTSPQIVMRENDIDPEEVYQDWQEHENRMREIYNNGGNGLPNGTTNSVDKILTQMENSLWKRR